MTPELLHAGARRARRTPAAGAGRRLGRPRGELRPPPAARRVDTVHGTILYLDGITVSFDGFKALNGLTLDIDAGELRCIIGPNGAGKTTMMDVITGKTRPDAGTCAFGSTSTCCACARRDRAGRHRPQVPEAHRVRAAERVREPRARAEGRPPGARLGAVSAQRRAGRPHRRVLALIHLKDAAQRTAGLLSHGQKQWLEIGMLLMQDPQLLLLDEPVAGMTDEETERTAELFLTLEGDHSLVVVEHDMEFIGELTAAPGKTARQEGHRAARGQRARRGPARRGAGRRQGGRGLPRPLRPTRPRSCDPPTHPPRAPATMLKAAGINQYYGGSHILRDVSFEAAGRRGDGRARAGTASARRRC